MVTLKVTTVGNSTGVILPKEALSMLKVNKGSVLILTETPEGCLLTPYDPEFEKDMQAAYRGMDRFRNALRELAK
jgi:putative addiction module antidote